MYIARIKLRSCKRFETPAWILVHKTFAGFGWQVVGGRSWQHWNGTLYRYSRFS